MPSCLRISLAVLLLLAPQVFAKPCEEIFLGGNAIELEVYNNHILIEALTTSDGTVGGLFGKWQIPHEVSDWATRETLWDSLTFKQKSSLLQALTKLKFAESSFFADRQIPNLKLRSHLTFKFLKPTEFLGREYAAGSHEIDLSGFTGQVEYSNHEPDKSMQFIELHLRSNTLSAGDLVLSAYSLNARLTSEKPNFHAHLVAPIPVEELKRDPDRISLNLTELYRRSNLLMEFLSLLSGRPVGANVKEDVTYFDAISPSFLVAVYRYLRRGWNEHDPIADEYKMGWIGFRGEDTYDQKGVFGFEVRAIEPRVRHALIAEILSRIEAGLRKADYGFSPDLMARYQVQRGNAPEEWLSTIWYRRSWKEIRLDLPPYLQNIFKTRIHRWIWFRDLQNSAGRNEGAKVLLYNWAADPLFFENKEAQARVIEAQRWALTKFIEQNANVNQLLRPFLIRSGLIAVLAESFKVDYAKLMDGEEE